MEPGANQRDFFFAHFHLLEYAFVVNAKTSHQLWFS